MNFSFSQTDQEYADFVVRNRSDHEHRWPKVADLLSHTEFILPCAIRIENIEAQGLFRREILSEVYAEALNIHAKQTREEYIGIRKVEYIFHIEETLAHFLDFALELCRQNPSLQEHFTNNVNEFICAAILHDAIEDYEISADNWNFDTIFDEIFARIQTRIHVPLESVEKIRLFVRLLTKDKKIHHEADRNQSFYRNLNASDEIFVKLIKLADMLNNFETLDETRVQSRPLSQIRKFIQNLYEYLRTDMVPDSLKNNQSLEYILILAQKHNILERLEKASSIDEFDSLESEILNSLYLWSKVFGYFLHLEPPHGYRVILADDREYVKPDFFSEDELQYEGITNILDRVKSVSLNPEKNILPDFVLERLRIRGFLTRKSTEGTTEHDPDHYIIQGNDTLESALGKIVDEALVRVKERMQTGIMYECDWEEEIRQQIRNVVLSTRQAFINIYLDIGWVEVRGLIGPRMCIWLDELHLGDWELEILLNGNISQVPRESATP